jgi:AGCS family alanine or glycine:cation symporter
MESLTSVTGMIDDVLYTYALVALLVFAGVWFTIRTRFVQIRRFPDMLRCTMERLSHDPSPPGTQATRACGSRGGYENGGRGKRFGSSPFAALMLSTASRVGTGNIAGVSTAIALGGPGAILWMWVMCVIGGSSAFVESTLAQIWKVRDPVGGFRGGPAYYIEQALGKRWLGIVFAIAMIITYGCGFNALQAYNMSSSLAYYFDPADYGRANAAYAQSWVPVAVGAAFTLILLFAISGGKRRIERMTSAIMPVMTCGYLLFALMVAILHITDFPRAIQLIFSQALFVPAPDGEGLSGARSVLGGIAGSAVIIGIKRGLYSNESGMGSAPNAAATADVSHPVKQGLVQTLSVYIDTLVICTCSTVIVLAFYVDEGTCGFDGMLLVQKAVEAIVGPIGVALLTVAIFAFGISTFIANYFYVENNLAFITESRSVLAAVRLCCLASVFVGAQMSIDLAWNLADIFMGVQALINIVCILVLGKWAFAALKDYDGQRSLGLDPTFVADRIEGIPETEFWHEAPREEPSGKKQAREVARPIDRE